jgi:lycopene cyclase domain-containing protein
MPSYTFLTIISVILVLALDLWLTRLVLRPKFWFFWLIIVILHTIVDNYLNGRWWHGVGIVWQYQHFSGIKIWHTPLENYFFGWSLITLNLIIMEFLVKRKNSKSV